MLGLLQVALVRVVDDRHMLVVLALHLHGCVVDCWLEVAVLGVNHEPHAALHQDEPRESVSEHMSLFVELYSRYLGFNLIQVFYKELLDTWLHPPT